MAANRARATIEVLAAPTDGVLLAPIRPQGMWGALQALHSAMAELRRDGRTPRMAYVVALAPDGRIVPGRDPDASVFVLGYELVPPRR